jgi:hypothetical protein
MADNPHRTHIRDPRSVIGAPYGTGSIAP